MSVHNDAMLHDKLGIKPGVSATTIRKSSGREKMSAASSLGTAGDRVVQSRIPEVSGGPGTVAK